MKISPRLIHALFSDLRPDERDLIRASLGYVPTDDPAEDFGDLWRRYQAGEIGLFKLQDEANQIAGVSFYQVQALPHGGKDFGILASAAIGPSHRVIAIALPKLEEMARVFGCTSMSVRTARPALAVQFIEEHQWRATEIILRKLL